MIQVYQALYYIQFTVSRSNNKELENIHKNILYQ